MKNGLVISDLHMFARRSRADACWESLRRGFPSLEILVLNGDTFDFRWSTLPGHDATTAAALAWLERTTADLPRCEIHFVLGNHDCLNSFQRELQTLAGARPRLHIHEFCVRIGTSLFLHGDCLHAAGPAGFRTYREAWSIDRRRGPLSAAAYAMADRLGFTWAAHAWAFPRPQTLLGISRHLDSACPPWRETVRDCYFGHTHVPFSSAMHEGVAYHNTGSAIRGMEFHPVFFEMRTVEPARFKLASHAS